ncbi:biotin-dependent carboxyltransferase family protein [Luteimonas dalianensis]|uniref:5-oxoprolinase subunit C family protein n=1 Tax=Luteimonas dalianensis TaxID=1148196 RepID=UPI003BF1323F
MSIRVLAPGLATAIQAGPRSGQRHLGVAGAGALDPYSHAVANLLVGNAPQAPVLEITLSGPTLRFEHAARIALCGAEIDAGAGGGALPGWRPLLLPAGAELALGRCRAGARAYLAVAGGFEVADVLGSGSTDLATGFGGFSGRCLREGDVLAAGRDDANDTGDIHAPGWWVDPSPELDFEASPQPVRILPGGDAARPPPKLLDAQWRVLAASDRQGLRLRGPALDPGPGDLRPSEPVTPGTVQLPPDGQPIVLLADAQTHGGYPRVGHVIRADRPRLAQLRPGDALRFVACTPAQAHQALREQRQRLQRIALAIHARSQAHA